MRTDPRLMVTAAALAAALWAAAGPAQVKVDPELPPYKKVAGVGGPLKIVGAGEADPLCEKWVAHFCRLHAPNVKVDLQCTHSATALANLVTDKAVAAIMCREAGQREIDAFKARTGHEPVGLRVATDMVAVYVHKDNPIGAKGLSLKQLDAVFSKTRKSGASADIVTWGQLGLQGDWADKLVRICGRNAASDLHKYVAGTILAGGEFKDTLKQEMSCVDVVKRVAGDRYGIGYASIRFKTGAVAAVPVSGIEGGAPVAPVPANVATYPLCRHFRMYVNHKPGTKPVPMRRGFLEYLLSKEGQQRVAAAGYLPLDAPTAKQELTKVGL